MALRYVTVLVATELLAELGDWSEPLQVRVEHIDAKGQAEMVFRRPPAVRQLRSDSEPGGETA